MIIEQHKFNCKCAMKGNLTLIVLFLYYFVLFSLICINYALNVTYLHDNSQSIASTIFEFPFKSIYWNSVVIYVILLL